MVNGQTVHNMTVWNGSFLNNKVFTCIPQIAENKLCERYGCFKLEDILGFEKFEIKICAIIVSATIYLQF